MQTKTVYQQFDKDLIVSGYFDWMLENNPLLARLHTKESKGNGVKYNVKTARGNAAWVQPNDTIVSTAGTFAQRSAAIYTMVKQCDVDRSQKKVNSTQDVEALEIKDSADDAGFEINERMIHGRTTTSSSDNHPKGIYKLIAELESEATTDLDAPNNSQVIAGSTTSAALTIDMMSELRDAVKPNPDCYAMSKRMRRKLESLARASGNNLEHDKDELGYAVQMFWGKPIYIVDAIEDNYPDNSSSILTLASHIIGTTRASGNDNSMIFALRTDEKGFVLLQVGAMERTGPWIPDDKNANRYRFVWDMGFGLFDKYAAAALTGVLDTAL